MIHQISPDRIISIESFKGKVWLSLRARGAGVTIELTPLLAKQIGMEVFNHGRKIDREVQG